MDDLRIIRIGHNIYPDITEDLRSKIAEFKEKFNVEINFLFEDGIEIEYSDSEYNIKNWLGGTCAMKNNQVVFKIIDDFDQITFCDLDCNKEYLVIPLIENSYGL